MLFEALIHNETRALREHIGNVLWHDQVLNDGIMFVKGLDEHSSFCQILLEDLSRVGVEELHILRKLDKVDFLVLDVEIKLEALLVVGYLSSLQPDALFLAPIRLG